MHVVVGALQDDVGPSVGDEVQVASQDAQPNVDEVLLMSCD